MRNLVVISMIALTACGGPDVDKRETEAILQVMAEQQDAWNEGDVEGFMEGYWNDDSLIFIGSKGLNYGWQTTVDNYKESYPDKAAMGELQFDVADVKVLGTYHAHVIGEWTLYRANDTLGGYFTLLWKKMEGEWRIVADHTN